MRTLQERVAHIEGQMVEQSQAFADIRGGLRRLEQRMDRFDQRMDSLHDKMSRQFVWIVGIQFTTLVAMIGAVLARG
ncbi:MAG: hypothetical protein GEU99_00760 [Luteitalea sp.]|nr:hypothetical protein [Luteitalea sp.]